MGQAMNISTVLSLPAVLEPSTIYLVKIDDNTYKQYVTDNAGLIALEQVQPAVTGSGDCCYLASVSLISDACFSTLTKEIIEGISVIEITNIDDKQTYTTETINCEVMENQHGFFTIETVTNRDLPAGLRVNGVDYTYPVKKPDFFTPVIQYVNPQTASVVQILATDFLHAFNLADQTTETPSNCIESAYQFSDTDQAFSDASFSIHTYSKVFYDSSSAVEALEFRIFNQTVDVDGNYVPGDLLVENEVVITETGQWPITGLYRAQSLTVDLGENLDKGEYYVSIRYRTTDGKFTNWSDPAYFYQGNVACDTSFVFETNTYNLGEYNLVSSSTAPYVLMSSSILRSASNAWSYNGGAAILFKRNADFIEELQVFRPALDIASSAFGCSRDISSDGVWVMVFDHSGVDTNSDGLGDTSAAYIYKKRDAEEVWDLYTTVEGIGRNGFQERLRMSPDGSTLVDPYGTGVRLWREATPGAGFTLAFDLSLAGDTDLIKTGNTEMYLSSVSVSNRAEVIVLTSGETRKAVVYRVDETNGLLNKEQVISLNPDGVTNYDTKIKSNITEDGYSVAIAATYPWQASTYAGQVWVTNYDGATSTWSVPQVIRPYGFNDDLYDNNLNKTGNFGIGIGLYGDTPLSFNTNSDLFISDPRFETWNDGRRGSIEHWEFDEILKEWVFKKRYISCDTYNDTGLAITYSANDSSIYALDQNCKISVFEVAQPPAT